MSEIKYSREDLGAYMPEFIGALRKQLGEDAERWGDTWKTRSQEGQEVRTAQTLDDYFDKFKNAGTPINWLKVAGYALICWVREQESMGQIPIKEDKV